MGENSAGREQTRRDDVTEMARNLVESQRMAADTTERIIDAMLIQLERAEREAEPVPALVEALRTILNSAEDANQEYRRLDIALAARNALACYEQSLGKP